MLDISEITDGTGLVALRGPWQELMEGAADPTPFQSWEWQEWWWRHLGQDRGRLWVLAARKGPTLVGLLPLFVSRYRGLPLRRLAFAGTPLSDVQDLLSLPEHATACREAFLHHLQRHAHNWDFMDLCDLREGTEMTRSAELAGSGLRLRLGHHRFCPYIKLPAHFGILLSRLGKNLRANIGRRQRQLGRDFALTFDQGHPDNLRQAMEDLFLLHNRRWQERGATGAFSDLRIQAFHQEVAGRFLGRGWLRLHRLRLNGKTAASFYCFHLRNRAYYYLSGFDLSLSRYSLGNVLMAHAISCAISEGATEFDMLRGDETYKYEWKAETRSTMRLIIGQSSLRSLSGLLCHRVERYIEHNGLRIQRRLWGRKRAP